MVVPIQLSESKAREICKRAQLANCSPNEIVEKMLNFDLFDVGYEYGWNKARMIFEPKEEE